MQEIKAGDYSIDYPVGKEMLERISVIFEKAGSEKSIEHLRWQYADNCGGGAYSAFAVSGSGEDAAVYSLFKVPAKLNGQKVIACQSLDTLTGSDHRGKGLFSMLAKHVNNRCDEDGIAFIYGFPNDKSGPGFFKNLQWRELGHPPFLMHINNLGYVLSIFGKPSIRIPAVIPSMAVRLANSIRRKRGAYRVESGQGFLAESLYDDLWLSFSRDIKNVVIRDSAYIAWRYVQRPKSDYRFISIYRKDELCAVAVFVLREKHGGRIGYVMDVIYRSGEIAAGKLAVGRAIEVLSADHADVVLAWATPGAKTRHVYMSNWFLPLPRKFQPIKLFVGARFAVGAERSDDGDLFLSYADSDTV